MVRVGSIRGTRTPIYDVLRQATLLDHADLWCGCAGASHSLEVEQVEQGDCNQEVNHCVYNVERNFEEGTERGRRVCV